MTTNKLPWSAWSDSQEAGSQSMPATPPNSYLARSRYLTRDRSASNDSSYEQEVHELMAAYQRNHQQLIVDADAEKNKDQHSAFLENSSLENKDQNDDQNGATIISFGYKKPAGNTKFQRSTLFADKDFADEKIAEITSMEDIQQLDEAALQSALDSDVNGIEINDVEINDFENSDDIKSVTVELVFEEKIESATLPLIESQISHLNISDDEFESSDKSSKSSNVSSAELMPADETVTTEFDNVVFAYKKADYQKPVDQGLNLDGTHYKNNINHNFNQPKSFKHDAVILAKKPEPKALEPVAALPERVFMNSLMKHTLIALAIIIPLAAFTAYAATPNLPANSAANATNASATVSTHPNDIIYQSASTPTSVEKVDLQQYSGTWFEIGRLPMSFQKKCQGDVTATYTPNDDGSIHVLNQCAKSHGKMMVANGQAKPVDDSGSKLKVTFLPSWIRWIPVGRADYWVLARDDNYQTALVGTPNKKYLWLLARSPNISQQTYTKYRQIAQQQGYDLTNFTLTPQSGQTVKLAP